MEINYLIFVCGTSPPALKCEVAELILLVRRLRRLHRFQNYKNICVNPRNLRMTFSDYTKIVCSRAGPMDAMNNFAFVSSAIAFRYARAFGGKSANLRALSVGVRQPSNST